MSSDYGWNGHNVATKPDRTVISSDRCLVEIMVAERPAGGWAASWQYSGPTGSGGWMPSLARFSYPTKEEAVDAGLDEVLSRAQDRANSENSCMSAGERRDWAKLVERIVDVRRDRAENQMDLPL